MFKRLILAVAIALAVLMPGMSVNPPATEAASPPSCWLNYLYAGYSGTGASIYSYGETGCTSGGYSGVTWVQTCLVQNGIYKACFYGNTGNRPLGAGGYCTIKNINAVASQVRHIVTKYGTNYTSWSGVYYLAQC